MLKIHSPLVSFSLLLLCLCWGCGTGEYESRMGDSIRNSQKGSKFNELNAAQELPGSKVKVSIRMPNIFKDPPLTDTTEARRLNPMLLPGLKSTYEATIEDKEHGFLPYYCHIGISEKPSTELEISYKNDLPKSFTVLSDWAPFSAKTPEGRETQWKKLRVSGKMDFFYKKDQNAQGTYVPMDGIMDIYLYQEPGAPVVLIAWRLPKDIEQNISLDKWATLVAGSVSVQP